MQACFLHRTAARPGRAALACAAVICALAAASPAHAEPPTFVDGVTFVQYSDAAVALADVGAGRLDIHYAGLSPELVDPGDERVRIYESQSGSYSLLVNPAPGDNLNVFADREARHALNYLLDRSLIVNELLGGHGVAMHSAYAPHDPDHAALASLGASEFAYDPARARKIIGASLERAGAALGADGTWTHGGEPVSVTVFIRSDDLVRKSIGEVLALELSQMGLEVRRDYGDLNKAFVVVYGSDPAEHRWSVYTEGWAGKAGFVRYDPVVLAQMYAPWFSAMPGFNDPTYWNYRNDAIDGLTRSIYAGNFTGAEERDALIRSAAAMGVDESVRVFLAARYDLYAAGSGVEGVVNDFGAGVPSRFTPINAQTPSGHLRVGMSQIYQGAWNPVMGLSDAYSSRIWAVLSDPAVFSHPYHGSPFPVRATWSVETGGPGTSVEVPESAVLWDAQAREWTGAAAGTSATSAVTFDLALSSWHHGEPMDMDDVMYAVYFALEWSSASGTDDRLYDAEYASRAAQLVSTLKGVEVLDEDTVRVYTDYWHFDEDEIANWASVWPPVPWEIHAGMERAVSEGDAAFSRSGSASAGVPWLSLIIPSDADLVAGRIAELAESGRAPDPLEKLGTAPESAAARYAASLDWIEKTGHAVISHGPFYLVGYEPESRTIRAASFDDPSYPFEQGHWLGLADVELARITGVDIPRTAAPGDPLAITVESENASEIRYLIVPTGSAPIVSASAGVEDGITEILVPSERTSEFPRGAHTLVLYAVSETVLRPDIFSTGFLVTDSAAPLPAVQDSDPAAGLPARGADLAPWIAAAVAAAAAGALALWLLRARRLRAGDK